jgi:organic radical activating enzyme
MIVGDGVEIIKIKEELLIPIAETFTSVQGEGAQSGIRMFFIRLAGCTVGKRYPKEHYGQIDNNVVEKFGTKAGEHDFKLNPFIQYPGYVNMCSTFDGKGHFPCDTNYTLAEKVSISDLISRIPKGVEWVSITGGESLMHMDKVAALCKALREKKIKYHIETSGTIIPEPSIISSNYCYLACSPKANYLRIVIGMANEIRLMVDKDFNVEKAAELIFGYRGQVFLSPLSRQDDIMAIDRASIVKCLELQEMKEFSHARISIQVHKIMGLR